MSEGGGEPVATDEPTVVSKPLFDTILVEDRQGDSRFPDSTCTDESDWSEVFSETNDLGQLIASAIGPRRWGR